MGELVELVERRLTVQTSLDDQQIGRDRAVKVLDSGANAAKLYAQMRFGQARSVPAR